MLKKLIQAPTRLFLLQTKQIARMSELKEYVCLRESLNDQASEKAAKDFQSLCQKYNLSPEDLTALFRVINSDPELLKQHVSYESWQQEYEALKFGWRSSPFFASGQSLQRSVQNLRAKYPEVVNFEANQSERVKAYHTLENIFLRDGPALKSHYDNASVARFLPEFEKRISGHINELKNNAPKKQVDAHGVHTNVAEADSVTEIARSLGAVYAKLQANPAYVYGNIRHFIALHKQNLGELEPRQPTQTRDFKTLEERSVTVARGEITDPLELGDDLPAILAEENKELKKTLGYNFLPWLNDRKLIFEAQADRGNTLLYGALAGLFGTYLLYKLYQGDATYTSLVAVFAATSFCLGRHRVNTARNNLDYLVQMNIHRDGRTLDLFIQRANNQVSKIEGVPVSDFKLVRNDYQFNVPDPLANNETVQEIRGGATGVKLSDLRRVGVGRGCWVATYGQDTVFVPMNYQGNSSVLQQVFKGENVNTSS